MYAVPIRKSEGKEKSLPASRDLVLGKYELLEELNSGGNATVWKALAKIEGKSEFVAAKILENRPGESAVVQQMFDNEVGVLRTLQGSINIANYIDSGFDKQSKTYVIVMEYFEQNLEEKLLKEGPFLNIELWKQSASALINAIEIAHRRQIGHRDLKPGNVMVRKTSESSFDLVLIDFGIASVPQISTKNVTVRDWHTPHYAPSDFTSYNEYARDLFALAAIFVRMLSNNDFTNKENLYLTFENIKSQKLLPTNLLEFIDNAIYPKGQPNSSINKFKSDFSSALKKEKLQSPIRVPIYLNPEIWRRMQKFHDDLDGNEIVELFKKSGVTAVFKYFGGEIDKNTIYVIKDRIQLSCRVSHTNSVTYLEAFKIDLLDDGLNEIKRSNGKEVDATKFSFVFGTKLEGMGNVSVQDLLEFIRPESKIESEKPELAAKLDLYRRLIDARKSIMLGDSPTISFKDLTVKGRRIVCKVENLPVLPELQSIWEVQGHEKYFFELLNFEENSLEFESNFDSAELPKSGVLRRSLGMNRASLRRQQEAIDRFREMGVTSNVLATVLEDPKLAKVQSSKEPIEFFRTLDIPKQNAVELALNSEDVCVIQGPPGTGKTQFIVELVQQVARSRENTSKVLLVSQTHIAVDNAIQRLTEAGFTSILRVGREEKVSGEAKEMILEKRLREWQEQVKLSSQGFMLELSMKSGIAISEIEKAQLAFDFCQAIKPDEEYQVENPEISNTVLTNQIREALDDSEPEIMVKQDNKSNKLDELTEILITELSKLGFKANDLRLAATRQNPDNLFDDIFSINSMSEVLQFYQIQRDWLRRFPHDMDLKRSLVKQTRLFAGTCVGFISSPFLNDLEFDLCIIDEASKATSTEMLIAISKSKRTVLVGDSNQLPPNDEELLRSEDVLKEFSLSKQEVQRNLFDELSEALPEKSKIMLDIQYRMDPAIGNLISKSFYNGDVTNGPQQPTEELKAGLRHQIQWHDTSRLGPVRRETSFKRSYFNKLEVDLIINFLKDLLQKIDAGELGFPLGYSPSILVIAPYSKQVQELRRAIRINKLERTGLRVETVDAVQGLESDFSIISVTRSNSKGKFGFVGEDYWRRQNVALSRSRHGLFIFGDAEFIVSKENGFRRAFKYIINNSAEAAVKRLVS